MNFLSSSSPSNILLLTTFFLISYFPIFGRARRESHIIDIRVFKSDCAFHLDNYGFNLCPLAGIATVASTKYSGDGHIDRVEESSSGTKLYEVALGGVEFTGGSRLSCDSDTWVCMTDEVSIETQDSEDGHHLLSKKQGISIARINGANSQHGKITVVKHEESITLRLSLDGGQAKGHPQSVEIEVLCDFNVESNLEFINEHNGIHSFQWTTLHGCPTNIKGSYIKSSRLSVTTDGADDESESEQDNELLPQSGHSTARRWIAVILVVVVTVLCSSLFLAYPRARHVATETILLLSYSLMPILSTAVIQLRPFGRFILAFIPQSLLCGAGNLKPFRQGSNQLVIWAEEDMTLREADGYDEERWSGVDFDEYIPLTANPKHGGNRDVKSYGAMPDVETFEQRDRGIGRIFGK